MIEIKMVDKLSTKKYFLIGDNLSLDFINTQIIEDGKPQDLITGFDDFLSWAVTTGLAGVSQAEQWVKGWNRDLNKKRIFQQALSFRRMLRETYESIAKGNRSVKPATIQTINSILQERYGHYKLVKTEKGFEKQFQAHPEKPEQLLVPIAESAANLLSNGNAIHLKKCESQSCILYFYDTTKNQKRRWCSMTACGNRAKAAAFYQRQRERRLKS